MTAKTDILLEEIRDLLLLLAEPAIARRDSHARNGIREVTGRGGKRQKAVLAMDGTHTRQEVISSSGIDAGGLSRLIAELKEAGFVVEISGKPKTLVPLPPNFFEGGEVAG